MTLTEIKAQAAALLDVTAADFTINGADVWLVAANQVRRRLELLHDFEFSRKLVSVSVNGVTGGDLTTAVLYGTATAVSVKSVIDVGLFDDDGNLRPAEWTTVAESLERQRQDNRFTVPRYPSDNWFDNAPMGVGRFDFSGDKIYRFPLDSENNFTLGLEVYAFNGDWATLAATNVSPWTTIADEYLTWATVLYLNTRFKEFVPREQGNLSPPTNFEQNAVEALRQWDIFRFEGARRHNR